MNSDTLAALVALAEALAANLGDLKSLRCYGDLPAHLADAIDDHHDDYNPLEI